MHIDPNRDKDTPLRNSDEKVGHPVSLSIPSGVVADGSGVNLEGDPM
jgi:hypothetical protein